MSLKISHQLSITVSARHQSFASLFRFIVRRYSRKTGKTVSDYLLRKMNNFSDAIRVECMGLLPDEVERLISG